MKGQGGPDLSVYETSPSLKYIILFLAMLKLEKELKL